MICLRPINVKVGRLLAPAAINGLLKVPCGNCQNCLINKKRILQNRLVMESCEWNTSCHVALTFNDDNLPKGSLIDVRTTQIFIKKLRRRIQKKDKFRKMKYFICGEYGFGGERIINPHYHAILYGLDAKEDFNAIATAWTNKNKKLMCNLEQLKPVELTPELAAYSCAYVAKKAKDENNRWIDRDQAFIYKNFKKENRPFANWSNGIGLETVKKIKREVKKYENATFNTIRTGQKKYPLGRYLKENISGKDIGYLNSGCVIKGHIPYAEKILKLWQGQVKFLAKQKKYPKVAKHNDERRTL